ncbi:MAG: transglutaminase domain-containing protein [Chloroflexia bacterium]|nr:transglutaminase domain-containing protein [Chloroflexia bacterium]
MVSPSMYATQSPVTDPGDMAWWLAGLPADLDGLRRVARDLVIHYRADDPVGHGIPAERLAEIDTRYAGAMLHRLHELAAQPLTTARQPAQRLVGCCRDFTILFLTLARYQGIPARARVGFATYFVPGFNVDHEIAEVWDATERRWRLVDAELSDDHVDPTNGAALDGLDIPRDRFLTGGTAWLACRDGQADPARFVVDPGLDIPSTRSWPQLRNNLIHDLAVLNKVEPLLWDAWGFIERDDLSAAEEQLLDDVAVATAAGDAGVAHARVLYSAHAELRMPPVVVSYDPLGGPSRQVRHAI